MCYTCACFSPPGLKPYSLLFRKFLRETGDKGGEYQYTVMADNSRNDDDTLKSVSKQMTTQGRSNNNGVTSNGYRDSVTKGDLTSAPKQENSISQTEGSLRESGPTTRASRWRESVRNIMDRIKAKHESEAESRRGSMSEGVSTNRRGSMSEGVSTSRRSSRFSVDDENAAKREENAPPETVQDILARIRGRRGSDDRDDPISNHGKQRRS